MLFLGEQIRFQDLTDLGRNGALLFLGLSLQGLVQLQWKRNLHPFCFSAFFHKFVTPLFILRDIPLKINKGYSLIP